MIFLHGMGDSAEDLLRYFEESSWFPDWVPKNTRIILPTAPVNPVTMNQGARMTSWFDVTKPDNEDAGMLKVGSKKNFFS